MGFAIKDASKAIKGCGHLDVAVTIEHMNRQVLPKEVLTAPNGTIKVKEEG
jgi:hypothetical protein